MPLERYALRELRPLGYIRLLPSRPMAVIFEASDGIVYNAKVGEYAGANFGKIQEITRGGVVINELFQRHDGSWEERLKTLDFP